jgi:hypothetical protein
MQTSYSIDLPAVSYPGQLADDSQVKDVLSALAVAAAIAYGVLAVSDDSNGAGFDQLACKVPAASASITTVGAQLGVVLADQARAQDPSVAYPQFPQYSGVPCLRKGRVWVNAETAMADGLNPFIRFASGTGTLLGSFRDDADSTTAVQMAAGQAVMRGTTSAAGYAVVEMNLV